MSIAPRETKWRISCKAPPGTVRVRADGEDAALRLDGRRVAERAALRRPRRRRAAVAARRRAAPARRPAGSRRRRARRSPRSPARMSLRSRSSSLCSVAMRDRHAGDVDRLEHRVGAQVAELADVPADLLERRDRGRRRELPGHGPAWVAPDRAEAALQREVVDLDDGAVDLELELAAAALPVQALRDRRRARPRRP